MTDRLSITQEVSWIIESAQEDMDTFGFEGDGVRHIYRALLRNGGLSIGPLLRSLGLRIEDMISSLEEIQFTRSSVGAIQVRTLPETRDLFKSSEQMAKSLGHTWIGPEHLLLSVALLQTSPCSDYFRRQGISIDSLTHAVVLDAQGKHIIGFIVLLVRKVFRSVSNWIYSQQRTL